MEVKVEAVPRGERRARHASDRDVRFCTERNMFAVNLNILYFLRPVWYIAAQV